MKRAPWYSFKMTWSITRRAWLFRATVTSLLLLTLCWLASEQWLPQAYWRAQDDVGDGLARQTLRSVAAQAPESRITIIDIDETSLEVFGSWPWPRSLTAQLIQGVAKHNPKVIGLDIVFPDVTRPVEDRALARVFATSPVVLAQAFDLNPISEPPKAGQIAGGMALTGDAVPAHGYIGNHPVFVEAVTHHQSACVGHITPSPSADGVVRHIAPWIGYEQQQYPMLALAMMACATSNSSQQPSFINKPLISHGQAGQWRFPWVKAIESYTVISAKDVLSGQVDQALLRGRYVIIGSSALGIGDRVASPIAPWLPGVMAHAQILTVLLDHVPDGGLVSVPAIGGHTALLAFVYSLLLLCVLSVILYRHNLLGALLAAILGVVLWWGLIQYAHSLYWTTNWLLPWVMVLLWGMLYVPTEWLIAQYQHQEKVRRLGAYLAPSVVPQVLAENYQDLLKPQRRVVTILFVDVANYTSLAETLPPELLSRLTQAILSELTLAVHDQVGTLDKYMGDAVMALWGAPLKEPLHADRAIACALDMQARIVQKNAEWQRDFGLEQAIHIRVGINTGEVVVGEMGSAMRKTYTAVGDAVNIAARLQEQAKVWQHPILLGEATAAACTQHQLLSLGSLTLRGKHHVQMIYSLAHLGMPEGLHS